MNHFFFSKGLRARPVMLVALLAAGLLVLSGCQETGNMYDQPRYNPLAESALFPDGRSARVYPEGVVPYAEGTSSPNDPALTGKTQTGALVEGIPVMVDTGLVSLGQERFNIYCVPCHGQTGKGDGKVIPFGYPKPPDLTSSDAKALSAGDIFDVIANGKGIMFSYGYRVKPNERWAIIAYIRALQLQNGAVNPAELTPEQLNQIGASHERDPLRSNQL